MLLAISGAPTTGKDSTWLPAAESLGFTREVPLTTRRPRTGEAPGHDYEFVDVPAFRRLVETGGLTDWDFAIDNYYGTRLSLEERLHNGDKVVVQVLGRMAMRMKHRLPQVLTVMLMPSDLSVLSDRLSARGYRGEELERRLTLAREERAHSPLFDSIVPDADIMTHDDARLILERLLMEFG